MQKVCIDRDADPSLPLAAPKNIYLTFILFRAEKVRMRPARTGKSQACLSRHIDLCGNGDAVYTALAAPAIRPQGNGIRKLSTSLHPARLGIAGSGGTTTTQRHIAGAWASDVFADGVE